MAKMDVSKKKVKTEKFRVSFPKVFKPESYQGQPAKYSITMLFDKSTDLTSMKTAVLNAATEKWGPKPEWPKNLRLPFRDGNEKSDLAGFAGTVFVTASAKADAKIGVVDQNVQPIQSESEFYAGCYARATLIAFAYDVSGNRGVSFSLQNLQKLADGASLTGRKSAEEEFDAVEDSSENASNYGDSSSDSLGF